MGKTGNTYYLLKYTEVWKYVVALLANENKDKIKLMSGN